MESTHKAAGELIMRCFNLQNIIDELLALFSSTRYKLRFLR